MEPTSLAISVVALVEPCIKYGLLEAANRFMQADVILKTWPHID